MKSGTHAGRHPCGLARMRSGENAIWRERDLARMRSGENAIRNRVTDLMSAACGEPIISMPALVECSGSPEVGLVEIPDWSRFRVWGRFRFWGNQVPVFP